MKSFIQMNSLLTDVQEQLLRLWGNKCLAVTIWWKAVPQALCFFANKKTLYIVSTVGGPAGEMIKFRH